MLLLYKCYIFVLNKHSIVLLEIMFWLSLFLYTTVCRKISLKKYFCTKSAFGPKYSKNGYNYEI